MIDRRQLLLTAAAAAVAAPAAAEAQPLGYWYAVSFFEKGWGWETMQTVWVYGPTEKVARWAVNRRDAQGCYAMHYEATSNPPPWVKGLFL